MSDVLETNIFKNSEFHFGQCFMLVVMAYGSGFPKHGNLSLSSMVSSFLVAGGWVVGAHSSVVFLGTGAWVAIKLPRHVNLYVTKNRHALGSILSKRLFLHFCFRKLLLQPRASSLALPLCESANIIS